MGNALKIGRPHDSNPQTTMGPVPPMFGMGAQGMGMQGMPGMPGIPGHIPGTPLTMQQMQMANLQVHAKILAAVRQDLYQCYFSYRF